MCYLATQITVINEPRTPAPGMLWACHECKVLHDPDGVLAAQRARTTPYPEALKRELRRRFEWEAYFSLENAEKAKARPARP